MTVRFPSVQQAASDPLIFNTNTLFKLSGSCGRKYRNTGHTCLWARGWVDAAAVQDLAEALRPTHSESGAITGEQQNSHTVAEDAANTLCKVMSRSFCGQRYQGKVC